MKNLLCLLLLIAVCACNPRYNPNYQYEKIAEIDKQHGVNEWRKKCDYDVVEQKEDCTFDYMIKYSTGSSIYDSKTVILSYMPNLNAITLVGDLDPTIAAKMRIDQNKPIYFNHHTIDSNILILTPEYEKQLFTGYVIYLEYHPFKESSQNTTVDLQLLRSVIKSEGNKSD